MVYIIETRRITHLHGSAHFTIPLIRRLKLKVSSKCIPKCFCQLAQKTGALLKIFLDEKILLISWKISLPELVYSNQSWMTFSMYKPIQIFFAYHYLAHMLKCYYRTKENREVSSANSLTVETKSSERSLM